ncbi:MAG: HEPN domain-containing protein [Candidatus Margulisbacteria bacterium]|nr:HEPN domain-containing protein [Candidatus Margulisiibacteriota bacterium]
MKNENEIMLGEWLQFAKDDLESAEVILKKTDNYHISVYHSHQTLEKIFKWFLLKNGQKFPFIHDLKELFKRVCEIQKLENFLDDILFIDNLYPQLRYPTGDKVAKEDAEKSLKIAKVIFKKTTGG